MASSPLRSKSKYHNRSVSFPSTSHPLVHQFNESLCRLRTSESASSPSSLPSISNRLSGLEEFYNCVDDLLLAPNLVNKTGFDEAMDGHLSLLDVCGSTKDIFSQIREETKQVLSSIRRNKDSSTFQAYIAARKRAIKIIRKLLKDLKSIGKKDNEDGVSGDILKEAQAVTVSVLESLLCYVAGTKAHSKSLISKLLKQKSDSKEVVSEFEQIDLALHSLKNTETVQNQLEKLELSIEKLEDVLELLIRRLIKTRVSLLNILNH